MENSPTISPPIRETWLVVAAVALIDAQGRVLMQQRRSDRAHGGLWEFPGGKLEPGERAEQAAAREMAEELDLVIEAAALVPAGFAVDPPPANPAAPRVLLLLYTCRSWQGEPRCLDAAAIGWFTPAQIASLPLPPLDVPLLAALKNAI